MQNTVGFRVQCLCERWFSLCDVPRESVFYPRSGKWFVETVFANAPTSKAESTVVEDSRDNKGFGVVGETLEGLK